MNQKLKVVVLAAVASNYASKNPPLQKCNKANNCHNSHSTENETVFIGEVVANQVVEAEDANLEDGVVCTEAKVHNRQNAHKLYSTRHHQINLHIIHFHHNTTSGISNGRKLRRKRLPCVHHGNTGYSNILQFPSTICLRRKPPQTEYPSCHPTSSVKAHQCVEVHHMCLLAFVVIIGSAKNMA